MADRYWIDTDGGNWNTTASWSTTSGGSSGASVPGSSDIAIFDGSADGSCTIDATVNVAGMSITADYDGTISQGSYAVTVGASGYSQANGIFDGGSGGMTITTSWTLTGGEFQCGSQTILMDTSTTWTYTAGTLTPETSTVSFKFGATINGTFELTNMKLWNSSGSTACEFDITNTVTVNGTLDLTSTSSGLSRINTGTISAKGDINLGYNFRGTGLLLISGTGPQTLTSTQSESTLGCCSIEIAKSDTLTLVGTLGFVHTTGDTETWTYTSGTVAPGTSTVIFNGSSTAAIITGSHALYNVTFSNSSGSTAYTATISAGTTLTTTGTLKFQSTSSQTTSINTGTLDCQGNLLINDDKVYAGSAVLQFTGTAAQTITSSAGAATFRLTPITINKASEAVTLASNFSINTAGQDLTFTAGTFDLAGYNLTVADIFSIASGAKLKLKGTETITKGTASYNAGMTLEYYDTGTTATVSNFGTTLPNVNFTRGKTHNFTSSSSYTSAGTWAVLGSSGQAKLWSTVEDTAWNLDFTGTSNLGAYADVRDSDASGGNEVSAIGSTDSGGNTNWDFGDVAGHGWYYYQQNQ